MAVEMLERVPFVDPNGFDKRQQMANELFTNATNPKGRERSWTQGMARLLQAGLAGLQNAGISNDRAAFDQQRRQDMQGIAKQLGLDEAAMQGFNTPEMQQMALQLGMQDKKQKDALALQEQEYQRKRADANQDARQNFEYQRQLQDSNPKNFIALEQKKALQDLQNPELPEEVRNAAQMYVDRLAGMAKPSTTINNNMGAGETALYKGVMEGMAKDINDSMKGLREAAKASEASTKQGDKILQLMAKNPNVQGGYGTETTTAVKGVIEKILPNFDPDLGDQQLFQKLVSQLTPEAVGNLRSHGVQRITQGEIMNLIPLITATIGNTREGIKKILELNAAMNAPLQKANKALNAARQVYKQDPNFDLEDALARIEETLAGASEQASMNYMNKQLATKGQRLVINPAYDPNKNVADKYILAPIAR